ncbi:ABC transporter permease subunit [Streptomyces sp. NBC_01136]|uniref:ABC transporter permease n=1 Tax=Streptomyces sp. NBC_01136 TaxID=2903754 RepID=UPI00386A5EBC|nr:ABC transporter permease subunit [Streptomyces sp. NBC_01136]
MNFWEYLSSRHQQLLSDAYHHAGVVFQCMAVATLIGVVIGVVICRSDWAGHLATTTASSSSSTSSILTIPSLAMIGLLVPIAGLGVPPTVIALTLCGLLPVARNTIVGLRGVDPALVDAAKSIGMSRPARLAKVVRQAHLDPISENALSNGQVSKALWQQIQLTVVSTFFVLILAIPLGILLTRRAFGRRRRSRWPSRTWGRPPRRSACWRSWSSGSAPARRRP